MIKYLLISFLFLVSCTGQLNDPRYTVTNGGNLAPPPVLQMNNLKGGDYVKGGSIYSVRFTVTDALGFNSNRLEYSKDNGDTWQIMISATAQSASAFPSSSGVETTFDWAVPSEPTCTSPSLTSDSNQYKIRIFASGRPDAQIALQTSPTVFTVDSCAASLAADQFFSGTQDKGFIQFTINGIVDAYNLSPIKAVCIKANSTSAPVSTDPCWRSLKALRVSSSSAPSAVTVNYFAGFTSNTFNFYLWTMDQAENISTMTSNSGASLVDSTGTDYINSLVRNCTPLSKCSSSISQVLTANTTTVGSGFIAKSGTPDLASSQSVIDPKFFVMSANGTLIYRDAITNAIMKINLLTETVATTLIANAVTSVDGNESTARVSKPARLGFDFDENLYILDNNTIRKVTFTTDTVFNVTTIVGGGIDSTTQLLTNPLDLQISNFDLTTAQGANQYWYNTFEVLQNGQVYFAASEPQQILDPVFASRSQIKIFDPTAVNKIRSVDFSGTGVQGDSSQSLLNFVPFSNFGLILNLTTQAVQGFTTRLCEAIGTCNSIASTTFNSAGTSLGASGHAFLPSQWSNANYFNSRKGELYNSNSYDARLLKFNTSTLNWDNKLGTGSIAVSYCADGASALSCAIRLWDSFVGYNDQIYFIDNGRLRFIDLDGRVKTLTQ